MGKYNNLIATIKAAIKQNGTQAITGNLLQATLVNMVSKLGSQYQFGGVVTPTSALPEDFGDYNCAFLGCNPGTFTHFGGFTLQSGEVALFMYDGTWKKQIVSYYANTQVYGVRHFYNNASPDLTRIGGADLHRDLPVQSLMRRCVVDDLGVIRYYLDADDSTKKENGTAAVLDGTDGQVMVEIPAHYRKTTLNSDQGYMDTEISLFPFDGAIVVPRTLVGAYEASLDRENNILCSVVNTTDNFRGGANVADWDGSYRDLRGKPVTNINLAAFRTAARNRGSENKWSAYGYGDHLAIYWLFVIEYATLNSQKAFEASLTEEGYHQGGLGPGVSNFSNWGTYNDYNPIIPCGFTNSLGNKTGVKTWTADAEAYGSEHTESVPSYRGIENPFGHIWKITDGFIGQGNGEYQEIWVCRNREKYASSITSDYQDLGHEATADGYCKAILASQPGLSQSIRAYGDIFDRDDSGSASTYFCDYHWHGNAADTLYVLLVGGHAYFGSTDGLACVSAGSGLGSAYRTFGSRLCWSE